MSADALMAANLRYEAFTADAARAESRRRTEMLLTPARAVAAGAMAVGAAVGLVTPASGEIPDIFDGRDASGTLLATPVRTQPPGNLECTAYAVASMMEIWWCRQLGTPVGVPFLRIDSVFSGKTDVYATAKKAKAGVMDEGFTEAALPVPARGQHAWRLEWRGFDGAVKKLPPTMCKALAENGPIVISIDVYSDFHSYVEHDEGQAYTPGPNAIRQLDAHALCIIGYDRPNRHWIVRNSNAAWGREGYGRIRWNDDKINPEIIAIGVTKVIHPVP